MNVSQDIVIMAMGYLALVGEFYSRRQILGHDGRRINVLGTSVTPLILHKLSQSRHWYDNLLVFDDAQLFRQERCVHTAIYIIHTQ